MNINLTDFLNIISHNGIINPITLPTSIGAIIVLDCQEIPVAQRPCHVEPINESVCDIYFPLHTWYSEIRRRHEVNKVFPNPELSKQTTEQLKAELLKAVLHGNNKEIERLTGLLNENETNNTRVS